jgi:hypothetical protein
MILEHMVCSDCGAAFDDDLFAADPSETFVCPLCGTVALDAEPVEDRVLHIHCRLPATTPVAALPEAPRLSA